MKGKRLISVLSALALGTQPAMALTHRAARGDSYWTVAQRYGVDFGELLRLNGADESSRLDVGDKGSPSFHNITQIRKFFLFLVG